MQNKSFVHLVERTIKEQEEGPSNIDNLVKYIQGLEIFNLKGDYLDIIKRKVTTSNISQFAKSKGYLESGDIEDGSLAEFNKEYREFIGLPLEFSELINDESEEAPEETPEEAPEGEDDLGLGDEGAPEEGAEEELQDDVEEPQLLTPEQGVDIQPQVQPQVQPQPQAGEEQFDLEGRLAKEQLSKTCEYSQEIMGMIEDSDQLPSWVQAKLTKVADYIGAVKHYLSADNDLKRD